MASILLSDKKKKKKKKNLLRVSLCDSRTCHQQGGGEHMKTDIEDLVRLVPNTQTKVQLTSCLGLCNKSPNVLSQSRGEVLLYTPTTRKRYLEQQQQLQQQKQKQQEKAASKENNHNLLLQQQQQEEERYYVTSHKIIVSGITIQKVAYALGIWDQPKAIIRAMELKAEGNKALRLGNHPEALQHYTNAKLEICCRDGCGGGNLENSASPTSSAVISSLAASIWLSCIQCRIQWATTTTTRNNNNLQQLPLLSPPKANQILHTAAQEALQILNHNKESNITTNNVIAILLQLQATLEEEKVFNNNNNKQLVTTSTTDRISSSSEDSDTTTIAAVPVKTTDGGILAHLCVALADAWSALAEIEINETASRILQKAARKGYTSILTATQLIISPKIFRLREKLRIERSIKALSSSSNQISTNPPL